jgi:membrane protein
MAGAFGAGVLFGVGLLLTEWREALGRGARRPTGGGQPTARSPTEVPSRGWLVALRAAFADFAHDRISSAAGAVTFFALLALFPAISAFVSLYGMVADLEDARRQILGLGGLLPSGAITTLTSEFTRLSAAGHGALGFAFAASLAVSLWSANAGMKALIGALNVAYEVPETRGFVRLTLQSLAFTLGAIALAIVAIALNVLLSRWALALGGTAATTIDWLRLPLALVAVTVVFSVLFRFGPARHEANWRWVTPGGAGAALGWMAMSALFSWYVANFGHYNRTYGSLGAIVGFLTWVWLSLMVLLFGAELNNEMEKQGGRPSRP